MLGEGRRREGEKEREGERRSDEGGGGGRTYNGKSPRDGCNTMSRIFIP